jgi:hypothetical protein
MCVRVPDLVIGAGQRPTVLPLRASSRELEHELVVLRARLGVDAFHDASSEGAEADRSQFADISDTYSPRSTPNR